MIVVLRVVLRELLSPPPYRKRLSILVSIALTVLEQKIFLRADRHLQDRIARSAETLPGRSRSRSNGDGIGPSEPDPFPCRGHGREKSRVAEDRLPVHQSEAADRRAAGSRIEEVGQAEMASDICDDESVDAQLEQKIARA